MAPRKNNEEFYITETQLIRVVKQASANGKHDCIAHGTRLTKIETKLESDLPGMDKKLDKIIANQEKLADKQNEMENDIIKIKTEKKVVVAAVGAISGFIGIVSGAVGAYLSK